MTSLYVDRRNADLDYETDRLVVRVRGERSGTFPLAALDRITVRGGGNVSTRLLGRLWRDGIGFLLLSGNRREPSIAIASRRAGDVALRQAQYRLADDANARGHFASLLVSAKIASQLRMLRSLEDRDGPRLRDALAALQEAGAKAVRLRDPARLRGIEGSVARSYFAALAEQLPIELAFKGRNRRPPTDPFNVCLSLGYTLLHADTVRAVAECGLDPAVGFYHDPRRARDSLACDLAEPMRASIDAFAMSLFTRKTLTVDDFTIGKNSCQMSKSARRDFYRAYEKSAAIWRRWLRKASRRLANELRLRDNEARSPALIPAQPPQLDHRGS